MQVKSSQLGHKYAGLHDSLTRMIGMKVISSRKALSVMPTSGIICPIPWEMIIVDFLHRSLNRDRTVYVCPILAIFCFPFCPSHVSNQGPDADDFNPDRFIGENGELLPPVADTRDGVLRYSFVFNLLTWVIEGQDDLVSIHFPQIVFSLCWLVRPGHLTYVSYILQTLFCILGLNST